MVSWLEMWLRDSRSRGNSFVPRFVGFGVVDRAVVSTAGALGEDSHSLTVYTPSLVDIHRETL